MRSIHALYSIHFFVSLEALKRSRKRVRNALRTELPYLMSTEFPSNQENESSIANTSEAGCTEKAVSEAHVARWRSLFVQMDRTLQEEGKQLVSFLFGLVCVIGKDYAICHCSCWYITLHIACIRCIAFMLIECIYTIHQST